MVEKISAVMKAFSTVSSRLRRYFLSPPGKEFYKNNVSRYDAFAV